MAEFVDVMKQFNRMFEACKQGVSVPVEASYANAVKRPDFFEEVVMSWAAEHPEPVYPTWWKYMCMIGVIPNTLGDKALGEVTVERLMHISIPADIAEKLGLKPKEQEAR